MPDHDEDQVTESPIPAKLLEKRKQLSSHTQTRVKTASSWAYAMALVLLAAVILSVPFPFVRRAWMKELWGYYGLMNALCFLMIASQINHRNLSFAFAGMGLLVHDQIRSWSGAAYLWTHRGFDSDILRHLILSVLMALTILFIFGRAAAAIYKYQVFKRREFEQGTLEEASIRRRNEILGTLGAAFLYGCIYFAVHRAFQAEPHTAFGILRVLGGGAFFLGFLFIGQTLDSFFRSKASARMTAVQIVLHILALILIQSAVSGFMTPEFLLIK